MEPADEKGINLQSKGFLERQSEKERERERERERANATGGKMQIQRRQRDKNAREDCIQRQIERETQR